MSDSKTTDPPTTPEPPLNKTQKLYLEILEAALRGELTIHPPETPAPTTPAP